MTERLGDRRVGAIYTSDLDRGGETASIVGCALGLPLRIERALRERSFGIAEGRPLTELDPEASGIARDRVVDADARPSGGESLGELYERVRGFVTQVAEQETEGDVLVVTHGGVVRVAEAYCNGIPVDDMAWDLVPNASIRGVRQPRPSISAAQVGRQKTTARSV